MEYFQSNKITKFIFLLIWPFFVFRIPTYFKIHERFYKFDIANADGKTKAIEKSKDNFPKNDPLNDEIISFLNCIKNNKKPIVTALDGINALQYAIKISKLIKK